MPRPDTRTFKVGDIIEGICEPDYPYGITRKGWIGEVTEVFSNGEIEAVGYGSHHGEGTHYRLSPRWFKLHEPKMQDLSQPFESTYNTSPYT